MEPAISTFGLTKYYGAQRGIEELEFEVHPGEIFGFLGPNGAGKTTTIRLLLDLLRPTRGVARIFGLDVGCNSIDVRRSIGYIAGDTAFFESMKGSEMLKLLGSFHRKNTRVMELAERLELDISRPIRTYSRGMKQKLAIIQAMAHEPKLLILDEPTTGLDPLMQQRFYDLLQEEKQKGTTVFLSSHLIHEIEKVCDRVGIVRTGYLVGLEDVANLKRKKVRSLELVLTREIRAEDLALNGVEVTSTDGRRAVLAVHGNIQDLLTRLATLPVEDLVFPEATLEETFMQFYATEEASNEFDTVS